MKHRAAKFGTTKQSLTRFLKSYVPTPRDMATEDPINLSNQAEYFEDSRKHLMDLIPFTHTLVGISELVCFVGRCLELKTPVPFDTLQVNEWLTEVVDMPTIVRTMTTFDFYHTFNCNFESHGEKANMLLILSHNSSSPASSTTCRLCSSQGTP